MSSDSLNNSFDGSSDGEWDHLNEADHCVYNLKVHDDSFVSNTSEEEEMNLLSDNEEECIEDDNHQPKEEQISVPSCESCEKLRADYTELEREFCDSELELEEEQIRSDKKLNDANNELDDIRSELQDRDEQIMEKNSQIDRLRLELLKQQLRLVSTISVKEELNNLQKSAAETEHCNQNLKRQIRAYEMEFYRMNDEIKDLRFKVVAQEMKTIKVSTKLQENNQHFFDVVEHAEELSHEYDEIEKKNTALQQEIVQLRQHLKMEQDKNKILYNAKAAADLEIVEIHLKQFKKDNVTISELRDAAQQAAKQYKLLVDVAKWQIKENSRKDVLIEQLEKNLDDIKGCETMIVEGELRKFMVDGPEVMSMEELFEYWTSIDKLQLKFSNNMERIYRVMNCLRKLEGQVKMNAMSAVDKRSKDIANVWISVMEDAFDSMTRFNNTFEKCMEETPIDLSFERKAVAEIKNNSASEDEYNSENKSSEEERE